MKKVKGIKGPYYDNITPQRLRLIVGIDSEGPALVTQTELERKAAEMGLKLSHQTISNAVYGNVRTSPATIEDIAKTLQALGHDISAAYLRGDHSEQTTVFTVNQIAEYTGLSEEAINELHEYVLELKDDTTGFENEDEDDSEDFLTLFSLPNLISKFVTSENCTDVLLLSRLSAIYASEEANRDRSLDITEENHFFETANKYGFDPVPFGKSALLHEQLALDSFRKWLRSYIDSLCDNALSEYRV